MTKDKEDYEKILEELQRFANGDYFNDPEYLASALRDLATQLDNLKNYER